MRIINGTDADTPLACGITPGTSVQVEFVVLDPDTLAAANYGAKVIQLNVLCLWPELRAALIRELNEFANHEDPVPMTCAVVPIQHPRRGN